MHADLLQQAESLARLDLRGAPRQANLRRAVSSAYYALFHYLVDEACRAIMGSQHSQQGYRYALARSFVHTTMRFQRSEVLALIQEVEQQVQDFSTLPRSDDRQFFLICLLTWKELANR